jgi:hypothetical protein
MSLLRRLTSYASLFVAVGVLPLACAETNNETDGDGAGGAAASSGTGAETGPPACEGPLGPPQDPAGLTACCPEVGHAHCLDQVHDKLANFVGSCEGGGHCVPDEFIETGGIYSPKVCSSLNGAEGVCLSMCAPKVADKAALLPQDNCSDWERCVPCISPLDNQSTGACDLALTCEDVQGGGDGSGSGSGATGTTSTTCPHDGPPVMDVSTLRMCPGCGLGHCLDNGLVPEDKKDMFGACDATSMCVPDAFIETGGNMIPDSCTSLGGAEGRCMSTCMPDVAAKEGLLPRGSCGPEHLCVPCFDPVTGVDTGSCKLACDPGPQKPATLLPTCCGGQGSCLPDTSVSEDDIENLGRVGCDQDAGANVCVPHALMADDFKPVACNTVLLGNAFGEEYRAGACLPSCLPAVDSFMINQDGCPANFKCAPCLQPPYADPTGACDGM